jgi:hypothetical protein
MGNFERELENYNIKVSDIETSDNLLDKLEEAIGTMREHCYYGDLEVILNSNLLIHKDLSKKIDTIFGMKVTFQDLEECVSFVVKPYGKPRCEYCSEDYDGDCKTIRQKRPCKRLGQPTRKNIKNRLVRTQYENKYKLLSNVWQEVRRVRE